MRAKRTDSNQSNLVNQMRKLGMSVYITSSVGQDFPDLVVGYRGVNYLMEVKNPDKPPSQRKLRTGQDEFFKTWRGRVFKVETIDDVLKIVQL